ncbi:MAG TPA: flagellar biosynthesis anti-sigma factor FlgM [Terriglobales bacterium]|nr:flagellar biosynthesis anti-sigma factor FlgM [Terriglobales bacterium]
MRIDLTSGAAASGPQIEKTASSRSANSSATAGADRAELSESDTNAGKLTTAALNSPEVRAERVAGLRAQLASGTYQVSAAQVADSLLNQMRVRTS